MSKKLMLLALVFAVMAAAVPAAQAQLITAVAHRNVDTDGPEDPQISPNPRIRRSRPIRWTRARSPSWTGPTCTVMYRSP